MKKKNSALRVRNLEAGAHEKNARKELSASRVARQALLPGPRRGHNEMSIDHAGGRARAGSMTLARPPRQMPDQGGHPGFNL